MHYRWCCYITTDTFAIQTVYLKFEIYFLGILLLLLLICSRQPVNLDVKRQTMYKNNSHNKKLYLHIIKRYMVT